MYTDQGWPSHSSDGSGEQHIRPDFEEEEEEEEEEEGQGKGGPPLYFCTCRNNPAQCEFWAAHNQSRTRFYASKDATCEECGHSGTMKRANS